MIREAYGFVKLKVGCRQEWLSAVGCQCRDTEIAPTERESLSPIAIKGIVA